MTERTKHTNANVKLTDEQVVRIHQLMIEDNEKIDKVRSQRDKRVTDAGMTVHGFRHRVTYLKTI